MMLNVNPRAHIFCKYLHKVSDIIITSAWMFQTIQALDYEDELDLIVAVVTETKHGNIQARVQLFDNETGRLMRDIEMNEPRASEVWWVFFVTVSFLLLSPPFIGVDKGAYLCSPVPTFSGSYVPRHLCSPVHMLPGTSGVSTHSGAHRQYLIWGPCLACNKS